MAPPGGLKRRPTGQDDLKGRIVVPVVVYHFRGLVVTLAGSLVAVVTAFAEVNRPRVVALVGQVGQVVPPSPAVVGAIGIAAGLVTAVGGIAIQVFDRANTRRRADQAHAIQLYVVRRGCDELVKYSNCTYSYIKEIQAICVAAGVRLPPDPGPPPFALDHESIIHGDESARQAAT